MNKKSTTNLAQFIDHTLLKPEATTNQIRTLCEEAQRYHFFSVCVNSGFVADCSQFLRGSSVKVCSVVGFPLGAMATPAKSFETELAVKNGASEIDMVINLSSLKDRDYKKTTYDIQQVVNAAQGSLVKVILETCLLSDDEKIAACKCSLEAGAHFVKTSTGFSTGGATMADVLLMKRIVGQALQVKASGGIKTTQQALDYIQAGVTRLGTSSGISLIQGLESSEGY